MWKDLKGKSLDLKSKVPENVSFLSNPATLERRRRVGPCVLLQLFMKRIIPSRGNGFSRGHRNIRSRENTAFLVRCSSPDKAGLVEERNRICIHTYSPLSCLSACL